MRPASTASASAQFQRRRMIPPAHPRAHASPARCRFARPVRQFRGLEVAVPCKIEGIWALASAVAVARLHEPDPDLSVRAPRHPAAPPEPERELFRHLLGPDRELGPAERDVAYDAAQGRRAVAGID